MDDMGNPQFCPACSDALGADVADNLRAYVAMVGGPCIRCCRERPTVDGLFCAACYAQALLEQGDGRRRLTTREGCGPPTPRKGASTMPKRIQMTRRPGGWQTTPKAVPCGRRKGGAGPYGNPYRVGVDGTAAECVALFVARYEGDAAFRARVRQELAGKDLACWCKPGDPCHTDVLLGWANDEPGLT